MNVLNRFASKSVSEVMAMIDAATFMDIDIKIKKPQIILKDRYDSEEYLLIDLGTIQIASECLKVDYRVKNQSKSFCKDPSYDQRPIEKVLT